MVPPCWVAVRSPEGSGQKHPLRQGPQEALRGGGAVGGRWGPRLCLTPRPGARFLAGTLLGPASC